MFDAGMPADFRDERLAAAATAHAQLRSLARCIHAPVLDSADAVSTAIEALRGSELDALVIVPTMATPPAWALDVARGLGPVPVIVLALREFDTVPDGYDTTQATRFSLLVGVSMITNALLRASVPFELLLATAGDDDLDAQLAEALAAARAAAAVRRTRLVALGAPIEGYTDVEVDEERLQALGVTCTNVDALEVARWSREVNEPQLAATISAARELGSVAVDDEPLRRAAHVACVVTRAVRDTGATAGAVNCHGALVRNNPDLGVTACLALSLLAREGIMLACTGDLPVALALTMGRAVAGASLYAELYALDRPGDWVLAANGGEGDTGAARAGSVRLLPEAHYLGVHGAGVAVAFEHEPGPVTLASLTPLDSARGQWRLILADGEVIDSRHRAMEGPNGMVRIDGFAALPAYQAWCEAGASHHVAVTPGRWSRVLARAATYLGIESLIISRPSPIVAA